VLKAEIEDKNHIISKSEIEIKKRVLLIEQKQGIMDLYNKKIEQMIEKAGVSGSTIVFITLCNILFYNSKGVELVQAKKQEFTVLTTKKMRIESNNYNFSFNLNFGFSNY
jgi:hypothetical protein